MIAEARIPTDNAEIDGTKYQDKDGGKPDGLLLAVLRAKRLNLRE